MRRTLIGLLTALTVAMPLAAQALPAPPKTSKLSVEIEEFAPYQPQFLCLGNVEPGVRAFERLLLRTYPATTSLGDMRACSVGGRSEHYAVTRSTGVRTTETDSVPLTC